MSPHKYVNGITFQFNILIRGEISDEKILLTNVSVYIVKVKEKNTISEDVTKGHKINVYSYIYLVGN